MAPSRLLIFVLLALVVGVMYVAQEWRFFEPLSIGPSISVDRQSRPNLEKRSEMIEKPSSVPIPSPTAKTESPVSKVPSANPTKKSASPTSRSPTPAPSLARTASPSLATNKPKKSPTELQTMKPTVPIKEACLHRRLTRTRPIGQWNCTNGLTEMEDTSTVLSSDELPSHLFNGTIKTVFLSGDNWGQLCNKMGIFAGILRHMQDLNLTHNNLLALSWIHSETAWSFDLKAFSSRTPGVLLDCITCDGAETHIRCANMVVNGKLYEVSDRVYEVAKAFRIGDMYWRGRPRSNGFMQELVDTILPKKQLRNLVSKLVNDFHQRIHEKDTNMKSIGIHRRYMDSMCYHWFDSGGQYNCYPGPFVSDAASVYRKIKQDKYQKEFQETNLFRESSDELRDTIATLAPWTISCNYSFSAHQWGIINSTWPGITEHPFALLLADDNQTPKGLKVLNDSGLAKVIFNLQAEEDPQCFAKKKFHNMLADMWGMSLTDYHMGMVLSSCDDIVVHWRLMHNKTTGSSYPLGCYDPYYQKRDAELKHLTFRKS